MTSDLRLLNTQQLANAWDTLSREYPASVDLLRNHILAMENAAKAQTEDLRMERALRENAEAQCRGQIREMEVQAARITTLQRMMSVENLDHLKALGRAERLEKAGDAMMKAGTVLESYTEESSITLETVCRSFRGTAQAWEGAKEAKDQPQAVDPKTRSINCPGCGGTGKPTGDRDVCTGCGGDGFVPDRRQPDALRDRRIWQSVAKELARGIFNPAIDHIRDEGKGDRRGNRDQAGG